MVRIPLDPTAILDGAGGGDGQAADLETVVKGFLQRALTGGRTAAEGANHA